MKLDNFLIGVSTCIGEKVEATSSLLELYKRYKRYWNKACSIRYKELAKSGGKSLESIHIALHLIVLAEYNTTLKNEIVRKILNPYFHKDINSPISYDKDLDPMEIGRKQLIVMYYLHCTDPNNKEYLGFKNLYEKVSNHSSFKSHMLNVNKYRNIKEKWGYIAILLMDLAGISYDVEEMELPKDFRLAIEYATSDNQDTRNTIEAMKVLYNIIVHLNEYRLKYLELASQPRIKSTQYAEREECVKLKSEIEEYKTRLKISEERLNNADKRRLAELKEQSNNYLAQIAALNKQIKKLTKK